MTIYQWVDISANYSDTLLIGNGASIAVNPRFTYQSLIQHAQDNGLLTDDVRQLFSFFNTSDFELVLRLVWQASKVNRSLKIPDNRTHAAYVRVRDCLIQSVRDIHPEYDEVSEQLPDIYNFLMPFKTVLSLNYDLILYWVMMYGNNEIHDRHKFKDCFINQVFDDNWQRFRDLYHERFNTLVFYPHGNLILCRDVVEFEFKINNGNDNTLLNSILHRWETEEVVPLFVSEGTWKQKITSIQNSYYLSTVYREVLTAHTPSLAIYGWGFGEQDSHILNRMSNSNIRRVAVSVYENDQAYCNRVSQIIHDSLGAFVQVDFF